MSETTADAPPPKNAMEQIYEQVMTALGGTNPNQFLQLTVPGTLLNQADYAYDTTGAKPETVAAAESRLVDEMFDLATISGAPNGQRLSSQYLQALSVLVPTFDLMMPMIKNRLREFLASPAPPDASVEDAHGVLVPFRGDLESYYFALNETWLGKKSAWEEDVIKARHTETPEDFLEWYEGVAETRLAIINAAEGRMLAAFSPTDMDAILGALAAGPGGELQEAADTMMNLRLPSPQGGFTYPVDLIPSNWFTDLASDEDPVNLLNDPAFIAVTIDARRQALSASIAQIQGLLSSAATSADLATAKAQFASAQTAYATAQSNLQGTYTQNTITAANIAIGVLTDGASTETEAALGEIDSATAAVSAAKKDAAPSTRASLLTGFPLSPEDLQKLGDGVNALNSAQAKLTDGAQALSNAGLALSSAEAASFGALPSLLARVQQQLSDLSSLQAQLTASAAASSITRSASAPTQSPTDKTVTEAAQSLAAWSQGGSNGTDPKSWIAALFSKLTASPLTPDEQSKLHPIAVSAKAAWSHVVGQAVISDIEGLRAALANVLQVAADAAGDSTIDGAGFTSAVAAAVAQASTPAEVAALKPINDAASTGTDKKTLAVDVDNAGKLITSVLDSVDAAVQSALATPTDFTTAPATDDVSDAVTAALPKVGSAEVSKFVTDSASTAADSGDSLRPVQTAALAMAAGYAETRPPASRPAQTADGWMSFQFSFTSSEATNITSATADSSQTSWSVDLFLGSASGTASHSQATNSADMLNSDTSIQIGMKAAKVVINRGWFDPGVFKLSKDMTRLSSAIVTPDYIDVTKATPEALKDANGAILPCFPTAFLVVKDVNIQFEADSSALHQVQTVMDSRSAVGGGFLCFSASGSSAAHSQTSNMHSKSVGTVFNISLPGPQILGWFLEFLPPDHSTLMSSEPTDASDRLDIAQFVHRLRRYRAQAPVSEQPPQPPIALL